MGNVNEYEKLSDLISKSRKNIQFLHNYFCIKCSVVDRVMVKVGAVVFCRKCHETEFGLKDKNPVMNQRPKYLKWLKKYNSIPYGGSKMNKKEWEKIVGEIINRPFEDKIGIVSSMVSDVAQEIEYEIKNDEHRKIAAEKLYDFLKYMNDNCEE